MPPGPPGARPPVKAKTGRGLVGCLVTPVTCLFFFVNFIFFVVGVATLSLGAVALLDNEMLDVLTSLDKHESLSNFNPSGMITNVAYAMIGTGGLLMVLGFLGCCGVAVARTWLICIYTLLLALIVFMQLGFLIYLYISRGELSRQMKVKLLDAVHNYTGKGVSGRDKALDAIQQLFECCGATGGKDYEDSVWFNNTNRGTKNVPVMCCKLKNKAKKIPMKSTCQTDPIGNNNLYTGSGCYKAITDVIWKKGVGVVIIISGVVAIQLLAICCAVLIEKAFQDQDMAAHLKARVK